MKYRAAVGEESFEIELDHDRLVRLNGDSLYVNLEQIGGLPLYSLSIEGEEYVVFVEPGENEYRVQINGQIYPIQVVHQRPDLRSRRAHCSDDEEDCLVVRAPLAGRLIALPVAAGEHVTAGQVLAIIESMKMKMELKAPIGGVVELVAGPEERDVEQDQPLVFLRRGE